MTKAKDLCTVCKGLFYYLIRKTGVLRIGIHNKTAAVWREIQKHKSIASDRIKPYLSKPRGRLHFTVLMSVIEPSGTDRNVNLRGNVPLGAYARSQLLGSNDSPAVQLSRSFVKQIFGING